MGHAAPVRIGTWNLAGRWSDHHRDLILAADCDVWLLTEVNERTSLPGYAIHLSQGDRALILPQGHGGAQGARIVLAGREVNIWNGAPRQPGPLVLTYPGGGVTQQHNGAGVAYTVSDQTDFGLRLTSDAFRGFKQDRWFFSRADFAEDVDHRVDCLAALSY